MLTVATVITPLIEAQNALKESEEKYRMIMEVAPDTIVISRLSDGVYMEVNDMFCRRTRYSREEAIGRTAEELGIYDIPADRERMLEELKKNNGRVFGFETRYCNRHGDAADVLVSAVIIPFKGEECLFAISKNITDLKNTQKALQESEEKYRKILETMEEGYYEVDLKGRYAFYNDALCRVLGYSPEEMMGMDYGKVTSPEVAQKTYTIFNEVYRTGVASQGIDYEAIRKDGSKIIIETSAALIRDESGEPIGFRGVTRDITKRKMAERELEKYRRNLEKMVQERTQELEEAQEELVKKERLAVLGQLMATVSHELRNPLGVIRSSNFYLQKKINEKDPKIEKYFRRIEEQVGLCDSIVADLLEYTRSRHSETVNMALNPWLGPLLEELFEGEAITVKKNLTVLDLIPHDQEKMRRVIINVADNALQAVKTKQGGAEKDKAKPYKPEIFVETRGEDGGVIIEIGDNGIGMNRETLDRALEPLFTTRARGTGLGLANVDKIVKEHLGKINLDSRPDQGTTVTIFLPNKPNACKK